MFANVLLYPSALFLEADTLQPLPDVVCYNIISRIVRCLSIGIVCVEILSADTLCAALCIGSYSVC